MKTLLTPIMLLLAAIAASAQGWTPAGGPEGGNIIALAANGSTVLAVTSPGMIYRHDSQGWKLLARQNVRKVLIAGDAFIAAGYDGIFRSTDRGESWTRASLDGFSFDLALDGGALYAAVDSVIYRSVDRGESWDSLAAPGFTFFSLFVHDSVMLVGKGGDGAGLFRSDDRGRSWSRITEGLPAGEPPQLFHRKGSTLYAALDSRGVFSSTDGGRSWSAINTGLPSQSGVFPAFLSLATVGDDLWGAGRNGTYAFNGTAWRGINLGRDRALAATGGSVYLGSIEGIKVTTDTGRSWSSLNGGLMAHRISALARFGDAIIASAGGSVYRSTNNGREWTRAREIGITGPAVGAGIAYALGETIFTQGLFRTTDGLDWGEIGEGLPTPTRFIHAIAAEGDRVYVGYHRTTQENGIVVWVQGGVYRSTDRGSTWQSASTGLRSNGTTHVPVLDMVTIHGVVLAHTLDGLYRSTDGGDTWRPVQPGLPSSALPGIFARLGGMVYLAGHASVYVSANDGLTWREMRGGLEEVFNIHHISAVGGTIYISASTADHPSRIYRLEEGEWIDITGRFPADVTFLEFVSAGDRVLAATAANSIWRGSLDPVASVPADDAGLLGVGLSAVPNPFGSDATIELNLRERADVRLTLVSSLGEELATIHEGMMEEGRHEVRIDGDALPAGVYHVRLVSGDAIRTVAIVKAR